MVTFDELVDIAEIINEISYECEKPEQLKFTASSEIKFDDGVHGYIVFRINGATTDSDMEDAEMIVLRDGEGVILDAWYTYGYDDLLTACGVVGDVHDMKWTTHNFGDILFRVDRFMEKHGYNHEREEGRYWNAISALRREQALFDKKIEEEYEKLPDETKKSIEDGTLKGCKKPSVSE